jgi:DNA-binding NarL/FixJ family response regulator
MQQLRSLLSDLPDVQIVAAASGVKGASELIQAHDPHVVLIDMFLAGGLGTDILRQINSLTNRPTAIVMTSEPSPELKQKCLSMGAKSFIDKALDFDLIPKLLEQYRPTQSNKVGA